MPSQGKYVYDYSYSKSFDELQELPGTDDSIGRLRIYDMKQPVVTINVKGDNLDYSDAMSLFGSMGTTVTIGDATGLLTSLSVSQVKGTPFANVSASLRVASLPS